MNPTTMKSLTQSLVRSLLVVAGLVLVQQSVACTEDDGGSLETKLNCADYCQQAQECNGDVNRSECEDDCQEALGECRADELDSVQERLDECADETCDDFTGCSIDVGAQCYFGI